MHKGDKCSLSSRFSSPDLVCISCYFLLSPLTFCHTPTTQQYQRGAKREPCLSATVTKTCPAAPCRKPPPDKTANRRKKIALHFFCGHEKEGEQEVCRYLFIFLSFGNSRSARVSLNDSRPSSQKEFVVIRGVRVGPLPPWCSRRANTLILLR